MNRVTRRRFLKTSLASAGALGVSARVWAQVPGANGDIRVAVVGFNGQGKSHIDALRGMPGVRLVALCDADRRILEAGAKQLEAGEPSRKVETYTDARRLLESKEVDAISTATPNHWHALLSIWACQAGKDVYVEKPVSHNVWEGRQIVEAARKYNRIVQTGTQCRSSTGLREAVEWVRAGNLGKILLVRGLCYKRRASIGKVTAPTPIPDSIDYDLWCGPAAKVPLMRQRLHYDWHWVWNTGNGDLGNQGIHQMDIARWFLGVNELSPRVFSVGGRLGYLDDGETANTQFLFHDYRPAPLIFEVRGLPSGQVDAGAAGADGKRVREEMDKYRGASIGVIVHCENGYLSNWSYTDAAAYDHDGRELRKFTGTIQHHANFIKAVRSRRKEDLNADILEGHLSSALCHTGNISHRLGRQAPTDAIRESLQHDKEAVETLGRMTEHLGANKVNLAGTPLTLGVFLTMNPKTERFIGNDAANQLLSRDYRPPFVVPERV